MKRIMNFALCILSLNLAVMAPLTTLSAAEKSSSALVGDEVNYLANLYQVTSGFPRAGEGYFSPDGKEIVFQAYPIGYPFYQIYRQSLETNDVRRLSPGRGRTTCSYFSIDGKKILFASAHTDPRPEMTEKAAWDLVAAGGKRRAPRAALTLRARRRGRAQRPQAHGRRCSTCQGRRGRCGRW